MTVPTQADFATLPFDGAILTGWATSQGDATAGTAANPQPGAGFPNAEETNYYPIWGTPVTVSFFNDAETPVNIVDQKLAKGAAIPTTVKVSEKKTLDLSTAADACKDGAKAVFKGWKLNNPKATDVIAMNNWSNQKAANGAKYYAACELPQVTLDKVDFGKDDHDRLVVRKKVAILPGKNGAYDAGKSDEPKSDDKVDLPAEIKAPQAENAPTHHMGWKLTSLGTLGTGVADTVYTPDLMATIAASGAVDDAKPYLPSSGDVLEAQWGYQVTYKTAEGDKTEIKAAHQNPKGDVVEGVKLCADKDGKTQVPTGKWTKVVTPAPSPAPAAAALSTFTADEDMVLQPECKVADKTLIFHAKDGEFTDTAVKDKDHYTLSPDKKTLTYKGVVDEHVTSPTRGEDNHLNEKEAELRIREGYKFTGWTDRISTGAAADASLDNIIITAAMQTSEYFAVWNEHEKQELNFFFADGNTTLPSTMKTKVNYNSVPKLIDGNDDYCNENNNNKLFKFWGDKNSGNDYTPAIVYQETNLKAVCGAAGKPVVWNANAKDAVFTPEKLDAKRDKAGKDDKENPTVTHTAAQDTKLVAPEVTLPGHKLVGWANKADATKDQVNDLSGVNVGAANGDEVDTYYAIWEVSGPTVTFKNGDKVVATVPAGADVEVAAPAADKVEAPEGKVFDKWCAAGENGAAPAEGTCTEVTFPGKFAESKVVYASFTDAVTVKFDANGGKFAEDKTSLDVTVAKDSKVEAPVVATLPEGKVFTKWCEKPAAGTELAADCKVDLSKVEKNLDLVAVYKTAVTVKLFADQGDTPVNDKFSVADDTLAKDVPAPENASDYCKADAAKTVFDKWVKKADDKDFADTDKVAANLELKASCKAPVVQHTVKVTVGTETKEITVVDGEKLTVDQLKTAGVTCGEGQALKLTKADGTVFSLDTAISEAIELTAKCEAKTTPGGSGGSTGGSSSGGSYFGGGSFGGGSSTPSTPAKDKKPGDKKPGDKKPGAKQPVVNKFDKQFTKKVELPKSAVKRAAGADRVATSVAALSLAKNHEVVVLATGSNFPDALVGGALAGAYKAGVVLTTGATLEQSVLDSLKSYKTKTVHIVGGNGAVSLAKEAQLRAAGLEVIRHAGADRYATAQAVKAATLKALGGKSAISCNATGSNFPDALACSSAASQMGGVVDLVKPGTAVAKDATAKTVCAGGPACQAAGAGVDKVVGSDRYETAYKLAEMTPAKGSVLVSNGQSYADSLVAGALAGSLQADLVLAKPSRVNVPAGTKSAQLFGGTTVLPDSLSMYTK